MNKIRTSTPISRLTVSVVAGCSALLVLILCTGGLVAPSRAASGVHPLFDIHTPAGGPFPSDIFTVTDASQNTGLRVDLPRPDCSIRRSDCEDLDLINTLDGFNLQPRLSIPFNGGLDLTTVNSQTVFLIKLGDTLSEIHPADSVVIGINQIVWDPLTNTLHLESDALLEQHTRYALIVTNGLRDPEGKPVEASEAFEQFRRDLNLGQSKDHDIKDYRKSLLDALQAARRMGSGERHRGGEHLHYAECHRDPREDSRSDQSEYAGACRLSSRTRSNTNSLYARRRDQHSLEPAVTDRFSGVNSGKRQSLVVEKYPRRDRTNRVR